MINEGETIRGVAFSVREIFILSLLERIERFIRVLSSLALYIIN